MVRRFVAEASAPNATAAIWVGYREALRRKFWLALDESDFYEPLARRVLDYDHALDTPRVGVRLLSDA